MLRATFEEARVIQLDRDASGRRTAATPMEIVGAYARWAPVYDLVFGGIMAPSRRAAINAVPRGTRHVLEVGVGTGISLPHYPARMRVTGIDLSPDMLAKARERVHRQGLANIDGLMEMDAAHLDMPDDSFDVAMAMYVMTVVPDPAAVMAELRRVVRPGGRVIAVSHFAAETGAARAISAPLAPLWRWLGWNTAVTASGLTGLGGLKLLSDRPAGLGGYYRLLEFEVPA